MIYAHEFRYFSEIILSVIVTFRLVLCGSDGDDCWQKVEGRYQLSDIIVVNFGKGNAKFIFSNYLSCYSVLHNASDFFQIKKELSGNEAISEEVVAQAHIENYAMKLFEYADKNDRQSNFSK